jgi:uncharacterized protein YggE
MKQFFNWNKAGLLGLALIGVLLLATGCGRGLAAPAPANGYSPTNTITVSGMGDASGTPNVVYIQLGVNITDPNVGEAVSNTNETMNAVKEALLQKGVAEQDIQMTSFNVWPEERYDPATGSPTGERIYHVDSTFSITVRDVSQAGAVIEAALAAGANNVYGLSYGIDDTTALEEEARTQALADAKARAEQLAKGLGVTLGEPIMASESYGGGAVPMYEMAAGLGGGGGAPPVSPGQLTVSVSVNVTYSIGK